MTTRPIPPYLNKKYSILPTSTLYSFVKQSNLPTTDVTLIVILKIIKKLLLEGKHFDERNPSVILCHRSQLLENIFGMKALHVSQVQAALAKSLLPLKIFPKTIYPKPIIKNPDTKYRLSYQLNQLLVSAALIQSSDELFTWSEVVNLLIGYILSKKTTLLDVRNITVALITGDPLEKVFRVAAFHRSQIYTLIRKQLVEESQLRLPLKKRLLRL